MDGILGIGSGFGYAAHAHQPAGAFRKAATEDRGCRGQPGHRRRSRWERLRTDLLRFGNYTNAFYVGSGICVLALGSLLAAKRPVAPVMAVMEEVKGVSKAA